MSKLTGRESKNCVFNRRRILLGGAALAVASIAAGVPTRTAQAQAQPPTSSSGRKPNILFHPCLSG